MKYFIILALMINSLNCFSQKIEGYVFDKNMKPLAYSNILVFGKGGAYTNTSGFFKIKIDLTNEDTLKVSSVGYTSKLIQVSNFPKNGIIQLEEITTLIDEVVLNVTKIKYTRKTTQGLEKKGHSSSSNLIAYNTAVLIENSEQIKGKLKTIHLYLNRTRKKTTWKSAVFLAKLNIRVYAYDSIKNCPGKELLHQNLIVQPKNRKYILDIDVKDLNIPFPKNGICIGIEFLDENNEYKRYEHVAPSLVLTNGVQRKLTWSNYRNRGWKNATEDFMGLYHNLMMKVDVLFPKIKLH